MQIRIIKMCKSYVGKNCLHNFLYLNYCAKRKNEILYVIIGGTYEIFINI